MPHTLAHPAAVIPIWHLSKRRLPLSALVIGSLSSDFVYYVALTTVPAISHSFLGLITHCLPQSWLMFIAWRLWLRRPILELLGIAVTPQQRWSIAYVGIVTAAIAIGAGTHNILDSMTHSYGWTVHRVPMLEWNVIGLPVYKWIQYLGTVIGVGVLAWWVRWEFPAIGRETGAPVKRRLAYFLFPASIVSLSVLSIIIHGIGNIEAFLVNQSIAFCSGMLVGAVIYATLDRWVLESA